jgi:hypothetical protein
LGQHPTRAITHDLIDQRGAIPAGFSTISFRNYGEHGRTFPTSVPAPVLLESLKITGRVRPSLLIHRVQALLVARPGRARGRG